MSSTPISTLYKAYTELESKNASALEELAHLNGGSDLPRHFYTLFDHVKAMANSVRTLLIENSPHYQGMNLGRYSTALEKKIDSVYGEYQQRPLFRTVFETGRSLSPSVRDQVMRSTFSDAVALTPCLNGSFPDGVSLDVLQTPHDLIRYLHQVGVDLFFDLNRENIGWQNLKNSFSYGKKSLIVTGMYVGEKAGESVLSENIFIKRLQSLSLTEKLKPKPVDVDYLYVLVSDDRVSIQAPLGCHFASLKIKYTDEGYDFNFFFRNTRTYKSSAFRDDLTDAVLRRLGYDVTVDAGKHTATRSLPKQQRAAANHLESLVRFMVSLRDIDLCESERVKGRVQDTTKAFFAGVINLCDYLNKNPSGTYVQYAQSKGTYLGRKKKTPPKRKVVKINPPVVGAVASAAVEAVPREIEPTASAVIEAIPREIEPTSASMIIQKLEKEIIKNNINLDDQWLISRDWDYPDPYHYYQPLFSDSYRRGRLPLKLEDEAYDFLSEKKPFVASSKLLNYLINPGVDYSRFMILLEAEKVLAVKLGNESAEKENLEAAVVASEAVVGRGEPDEDH